MEIKAMGIKVKVNNKRERQFVRIVNSQIERIIEYWLTDDEWAECFKEDGAQHWMIKELGGQLSAMYYMDMINNPATDQMIFTAIENEVMNRESKAA